MNIKLGDIFTSCIYFVLMQKLFSLHCLPPLFKLFKGVCKSRIYNFTVFILCKNLSIFSSRSSLFLCQDTSIPAFHLIKVDTSKCSDERWHKSQFCILKPICFCQNVMLSRSSWPSWPQKQIKTPGYFGYRNNI